MLTGHLVDTNVAFRRYLPRDDLHTLVRSVTDRFSRSGEPLWVTPQILLETRALATRPTEANGLGMSSTQARRLSDLIEADFPLLPEIPDVFAHWKDVVDKYEVVGRQVYDARLVAVMLAHGVTRLLTFNASHFRRFDEITVLTPEEVMRTI